MPGVPPLTDPVLFCRACARFATGVTIVTVLTGDGVPHGMTANSFTSVSLDPLLVLVCVDRRAGILNHFREAGAIGINVLNASQEHLSVRFAEPGRDGFGSVEWYPGEMDVPLLPGALATLECTISKLLEAGDHTVLIAKVEYAAFRDGEPLIYFDSAYHRLKLPKEFS